ncbi:TetR/AcrR family transcriptional regulator [Gordonia rhizosphera]|uniref:Putative TetR family transcriptional regulator n=1 Tax=Gordonia rhizosphera NBRC 16068 TaxID=1108045 RepID=K6WA99_9ACTN|nr:TetR/AcrR family transcriptional regulator [Gordonia rhizosphera]GAB90681.1 putative TetR family transcriptional regulator [Gordonia rhizosphera NBRC 16068]
MASEETGGAAPGAAAPRGEKSSTVRQGATGRSNPRRELVEKEIMEQATRLFAERGFASTTLQDIADATGLTRPALYHYVANKDELFERLVSEIAEGPANLLHTINERSGMTPTAKLREMATSIALHQMETRDRFRVLIRSEAELPESLAESYTQSRRQVLREFRSVIDAGIDAGEMRPTDSRTAALGIIGMLNWIAWWHRPGTPGSDTTASELADMAVRSVAAETIPDGGEGPAHAIEMVRQNLDYLERFITRPDRDA